MITIHTTRQLLDRLKSDIRTGRRRTVDGAPRWYTRLLTVGPHRSCCSSTPATGLTRCW